MKNTTFYNKLIVIFLCIVGGGVLFLSGTLINPVNFVATKSIQIGSLIIEGMEHRPIDELLLIQDSITKPDASLEIATSAGVPSEAKLYTAFRYGGYNLLTVREFPKFPYIQVQARAKNRDIAIKVAEAATNFILKKQNEKLQYWHELSDKRYKDNETYLKDSFDNQIDYTEKKLAIVSSKKNESIAYLEKDLSFCSEKISNLKKKYNIANDGESISSESVIENSSKNISEFITSKNLSLDGDESKSSTNKNIEYIKNEIQYCMKHILDIQSVLADIVLKYDLDIKNLELQSLTLRDNFSSKLKELEFKKQNLYALQAVNQSNSPFPAIIENSIFSSYAYTFILGSIIGGVTGFLILLLFK